MALALAAPLLAAAQSSAAASPTDVKSLSVNLASTTGPATGVGEGILYGVSQDGTQPADQYLQPLHINAFRGGGWFSGGWIKDKYQYGDATKADIASIIAQAKRLQQVSGKGFQYQLLVSDLFGSTGGAPASTMWPCINGDCSNWITFIDTTVNAVKDSGINFAFDIWNEPDLSIFWAPGVNTPQYFQMWDTAYQEIRRLAPNATIVGPSFAFTPQRMPQEWQTWFAHVKAANTVPDMISNHDEGDVDDPVTVGRAIESDATAVGLKPIPLSANEYQPADRQSAGVTAWYVARFAQSNYTNAMRGNWQCCMIPNMTGLLSHAATGWAPTGNWWALRTYADLTGSLVSTSGEVGTTAISAAKDASQQRAVAIVGDSDGYTGAASVTFNGLSSVPWLVRQGEVHVTVYRIPDKAPLYSRPVVFNQTMSASGGSVTVPLTFQSAHDAFGVYLSWTDPQTVTVNAPAQLTAGGTYQIPVTFTNGSGLDDALVQTSLAVSADDPTSASQLHVSCGLAQGSTCLPVLDLPPGGTTTANFTVVVPATAPQVSYRLTGTATAISTGGRVTAQDAVDLTMPCGLGQACEAENGTMGGGACLATDHPGYTGSGFVACFTSSGPSVTQQFSVAADGTYTLDLRYAAGPDGPKQTRTATVSVNGAAAQQISLPLTGSWNTWADATIKLQLKAGTNDITVAYLPSDTGWFNLDHLVVTN
ncbi:RICIN domain-containing protein [Rugosimonospora acidiphila]|uniref:RICIN domain-containing protein n=2 Tax=Rugosimonospora acidiphila TaxID=556531 RepID=A0ABP9RN89_9ACTN